MPYYTEYEQQWPGFVPHLAAVDMLFACGPATADILAERRSFELVDADADAELAIADSG